MQKRIFYYSEYKRDEILYQLEHKNIKITVIIHTKNNENIIGKTIVLLRSEQHRYSFLKEIIVVDDNSTDNTRKIAAFFGATVYRPDEILSGRSNIQKESMKIQEEIIVVIDGDISNVRPDMIYASVAPLVLCDHIKFVNAFYPQENISKEGYLTEKQRSTKFDVHPLLSIFFPELLSIIQPLSGIQATWKDDLEYMPFVNSAGFRIGQLIDAYQKNGIAAIGQVELEDVQYSEQQSPVELKKTREEILNAFRLRIPVFEYEQKLSMIQDKEYPSILTLEKERKYLTKPLQFTASEDYLEQEVGPSCICIYRTL